MVGYCDADWAGDMDKRQSTTDYISDFNFKVEQYRGHVVNQ